MARTKQVRAVAISAFFVLLVFVLYTSTTSRSAAVAPAGVPTAKSPVDASSLIDSTNDDKLDAAINNEIAKLQGEVADPKKVDAKKPAAGAVDKPVAAKGDSTPDDKKDDAITNVKVDPSNPNSPTVFDPAAELKLIRSMSPITIFSKTFCPFSKKLKALLKENYEITPAPTIVELDKHAHGVELQAYLAEITTRRTVPNVLVGASSVSRGGADDFVALHRDGELVNLLLEWGGKNLIVRKNDAPSNV
ncbi:glutaredoxin [Suhomyces tanzawaensis NRRL Y-17324]|uniref:Glutaredoxin n=1 Tax=Suhomyces tanzawaensis NRRL Y-17324 TaxID=984487 RepID=A0A1E4SH52_9ASCO|nr:glutaredoxin [Suhomyces tanzawaensis NRRL Y-17324]ODV78800.1 glutaredoxin [Suhomyces tanzawaensis NRRL Y-17324]